MTYIEPLEQSCRKNTYLILLNNLALLFNFCDLFCFSLKHTSIKVNVHLIITK